jgi:signal transduction histidine kinase
MVLPVWGLLFAVGVLVVALCMALAANLALRRRLAGQEERHRQFTETMADWHWETDADHRFVWFSANARWRFSELLPMGQRRLEQSAGQVENDRWRQHLADLQANRPFDDFVHEMRGANEERLTCRVSGRPIFDEAGEFTGYRGSASNLTLMAQLYRSPDEERNVLRQALEHIVIPILILDDDLNIVVWNRHLEELFDIPPGQMVSGKPVRSVVQYLVGRGDMRDDVRTEEDIDRILRSLPPFGPEVVAHNRRNGRSIEIHRRQVPGLGYVLSYVEISERLQNEAKLRQAMQEAHAANKAKSTFLANMSHELRTPLNAIIGFAEIIEGQLFGALGNERYLEYVRDIKDSGSHLLEVINDILDLSKIEAGRIELVEEEVSVERVLVSAERLVKDRAMKQGLALVRDCPPGLPRLRADSRFLRQILLNLLSNAIKFTDSGGEVRLSAAVSETGEMALTVRDSGIGMDPADLSVALSPFGQLDNAYSRRFEGTGLGLPLVKSMTEMHGGRLDIETAPGKGTRITILLPAERVRRGVEPGL